MEDEEAGIPKLSKRFSDKGEGGEVDYKTKSGTAWSHNFLNQKPWHPLSYPNQRRKWIAEQTHAQRKRRNEEVSREYAQEQDFLRQTSLLTQKEKEKVDLMQAVSFMYVRPPGYNAESAKAAEIIDEKGKLGDADPAGAASSSVPQESVQLKEEKKKARPKDVFGRSLPTEEEFSVLKNAPKFETGVAGRAKPFAIELRNVKCVRCGTFGHQSGDRDCPMKDVIMPNEESRLKRDDPLTAIIAHMDSSEPLKWELKQKPGISPPRGGFQQDDPNQQIVAEEDIFDEYGGFLTGGSIPELLTNFSYKKNKKKTRSKTKHKKRRSSRLSSEDGSSDSDTGKRSAKREKLRKPRKTISKIRKKKERSPLTDSGEESDSNGDSDSDEYRKPRKDDMHKRERSTKSASHFNLSDGSRDERYHTESRRHKRSHHADNMDADKYRHHSKESRKPRNDGDSDSERKFISKSKRHKDARLSSPENSESDRYKEKHGYKNSSHKPSESMLSGKLESDKYRKRGH